MGFFFEPLACQAVLDLQVFVFGRVAQHLEARVLAWNFSFAANNGKKQRGDVVQLVRESAARVASAAGWASHRYPRA